MTKTEANSLKIGIELTPCQAVLLYSLLERIEDSSEWSYEVTKQLMDALAEKGVPECDPISDLIWLNDDTEKCVLKAVKNWRVLTIPA